MAGDEHTHHRLARKLRAAVITASDSRTATTDLSGRLVTELLGQAGVEVAAYQLLPDDPASIAGAIAAHVKTLDVVIVSGGTGIGPRDSTYEAVKGLLDKELEGFGELFRMLSYQEIGAAAFLSRATAGVSAGKIVVSLPGSPAACRLALEKLLLPQLPHMAGLLGIA